MKKSISTFFIIILLASSYSFATHNNVKSRFPLIKLENCYDAILWSGLGCPDEFDSTKLNDEEREEALVNGLAIFEQGAREGETVFQSELAQYYFTSIKNPSLSKALYWAKRAADNGSADGMSLLAKAYAQGKGVLQDIEEAVKWILLGAAKGHEGSKECLEELNSLSGKLAESTLKEGRRRANLWISEHEELFFSPD